MVLWSVLGAVSEEVALFTKVAKFAGTSLFPTIPYSTLGIGEVS